MMTISNTQPADERRFFSREDSEALNNLVMSFARGGGATIVNISSSWSAQVNWARNAISAMGDQRTAYVNVQRIVNGSSGQVSTNQIDADSLRSAVETAELVARVNPSSPPRIFNKYPGNPPMKPHIWDDATFQQSGHGRGSIVGTIIERASKEGIVSAGYLETSAWSSSVIDSRSQEFQYNARTITQLSTTMRDWKQRASGWAGSSSYAWSRIGADDVAARAIDKCVRSRNPVAVEPGRYTSILEPQAVGELLRVVINPLAMRRFQHEDLKRDTYWFDQRYEENYLGNLVRYDRSLIGKRVMDPKVTIRQLPEHPDLGTWPGDVNDPYQNVIWVDHGILTNMSASRLYVSDQLNSRVGLQFNNTIAMDGGDASIYEMIASTRRGLLVTRFSNFNGVDAKSLSVEAYTRDGLWLIENGKITKSVKNFRVIESPLFAFNDVELVGPAVPIFSPGSPVLVPPIKVREINYVSLADAV